MKNEAKGDKRNEGERERGKREREGEERGERGKRERGGRDEEQRNDPQSTLDVASVGRSDGELSGRFVVFWGSAALLRRIKDQFSLSALNDRQRRRRREYNGLSRVGSIGARAEGQEGGWGETPYGVCGAATISHAG